MRSKRSIRRAQRGVSLPMIAIAVAVMALILVAVAQQRVRAANELAGRSLGSVLNELGSAVELYRTSNLAVLTGPGPVAVTGFADPYAPTTTELAAVGILSAPLNLPAADYQIRLQRSPLGCTAPADDPCTVWAQTSLTNPILEPDGTLSATRLSSLVGRITTASASFSGPPNPAIIVGGSGSWTVANPDPGARNGIVMMVSGLGGGGEPWLRVGDTRNPNFQGPSVTGTQFDTPLKTVGDACVPQGAFASAANGIVYCNAGFWMLYDGPIVVGGAACTIDGAMGVTAAGASLMCIQGAWRDHLTYGVRSQAYYTHNTTVVQPTCGVGLTPIATAASASASVIIGANNPGNNTGSFEVAISPSFVVSITGSTGVQAGAGARALVTTACAPT